MAKSLLEIGEEISLLRVTLNEVVVGANILQEAVRKKKAENPEFAELALSHLTLVQQLAYGVLSSSNASYLLALRKWQTCVDELEHTSGSQGNGSG